MTQDIRQFPGFDTIRVIAAAAVVFSHSFLLAEGFETNEPVAKHTGTVLGVYAVLVFLILSGFLVTDSAERSKSFLQYASKRLRRIAPGFIFNVLFVTVFLCAIFAVDRGVDFLSRSATWLNVFKVLTFQEPGLYFPDVWFYTPTPGQDTALPSVANGVLWTIRLEAACYLIVGLLMVTRLLTKASALVLLLASFGLAFAYDWQVIRLLTDFFFVFPSFMVGVVFQKFAGHHQAHGGIALGSLIALVVLSLVLPVWPWALAALFPVLAVYPLVWAGQRDWFALRWLHRHGDPSYGMYLWGWPIQQVTRAIVGPGWSGFGFALLTIPLTWLAGVISWKYIEAPMLGRNRSARRKEADTDGSA
ncbi:MAG: acyltransferase [Rhodobacterales bacterium]|nr:MAG: acyltransferase [Rhodobacterales bacterium]